MFYFVNDFCWKTEYRIGRLPKKCIRLLQVLIQEEKSSERCHCEERSDVAISRYKVCCCCAIRWMVPGDSHVRASPFLGMTYLEDFCRGGSWPSFNHGTQRRYKGGGNPSPTGLHKKFRISYCKSRNSMIKWISLRQNYRFGGFYAFSLSPIAPPVFL